MSSALDMSLDDIIKNNRKSASSSSGQGRGRGRSGPGPTRRPQNRDANRPNPYSMPKVKIRKKKKKLGLGFPQVNSNFDADLDLKRERCRAFLSLLTLCRSQSFLISYCYRIQAADYGVYTDQLAVYSIQAAPRVSSIETGTKLYISNLDYGVSNDDIKVSFLLSVKSFVSSSVMLYLILMSDVA